MSKIIVILEGGLDDFSVEDSGMEKYFEVTDYSIENLFVRIQSCDESKSHTIINQFINHLDGTDNKIRVTIETLNKDEQ